MSMPTPITIPDNTIPADWIDYNGHMNVAYYTMAFDEALEVVFLDHLGLGEDYLEKEQASTFTMETHICYLQELREGDPFRITFQLLDFDAKRIHFFMHMRHAKKGYIAASCEQILLHVDMKARRSAPFPKAAQDALSRMMKAHSALERPEEVGRVIGIKKR